MLAVLLLALLLTGAVAAARGLRLRRALRQAETTSARLTEELQRHTRDQRSEGALQRSEERYRLVSLATQDILWDADLLAGTTMWAGALREILGVDSDVLEFDDDWWKRRVHPDDLEGLQATTRAVTEGRDAFYQDEYRLRHEDGTYVAILSRAHVVRDAEGRAVRLVGSMMDITARNRREAALLAARREADEASLAKSQFLANMSHEIRTPMNGVIGMVDLLLGTTLTEEQQRYVDAVRRSGERLLVIINDILDLSKVEAGKLRLEERDYDVRKLVAGTLAPFEVEVAAKGLSLTVEVAPDVPGLVHGDPERVSQVLTNLIGNAVKFTERGQVAVRVTREPGPATKPGGSLLRLLVEDSGIGMTRSQLDGLFQPFAQADASTTKRYGGTGLGLAISRQLVELMGGLIQARSVFGLGSAFSVELPLRSPEEAPTCGPDPGPAPGPLVPAGAARRHRGGRSVLLVEDNDVNQDVARLMLVRLGHHVHVVPDGARALEVLRTRSFDLVLMDLQMPGMDGCETTRRLRAAEAACGGNRRTPVVAMTANALSGDRRRALDAGMDDYLAKPVRLHVLDAAVTRWAERSTAASPAVGVDGPTPQHAEDPTEVLDPGVTDTLRCIARSMPATFLADLVATFRHENGARLEELVAAADRGDIEIVARISRDVGGSCSSLGAMRLGDAVARVERNALAGELDVVRSQVRPLRSELSCAATALEDALTALHV